MADTDITPALLEKVERSFRNTLDTNRKIGGLVEKLEDGRASFKDAYDYAESIGKARAKAFKQINSSVLPDGKMYFNIGERIIGDSLTTDHDLVTDYAKAVQIQKNKKAGIRLKGLEADLDEDRIKGFVDRLASEDVFDDVAWILDEPVVTYARSVVDDTIKKNADFQYRSGVSAKVVRDASSKCCEWCADIAGTYTYPNVPREIFQRHDNCKCTVDYEGRRLTAYEGKNSSHSFRDQGEQERIDARRKYADQVDTIFRRKR